MTQIHILTGPESSGKTTLASTLANYWSAPLIPEQSRIYLEEKSVDSPFNYDQADILAIAKRHLAKEQEALKLQAKHIICDTDLLVLIVWSEVKYGRCDKWILDQFEQSLETSSRHYILCDWQIPWEPDSLRENPSNREELFRLYQAKLKDYRLDYTAVSGSNMQRFNQAQAAMV
jgi:nicotinamide riboside kinase